MKCKFEGCDKEVHAKKVQLCHGHYQQYNSGLTLKPLRTKRMLRRDDHGRVCTTCEKYKPWSEYYLVSNPTDTNQHRSVCKSCCLIAERAGRASRADA